MEEKAYVSKRDFFNVHFIITMMVCSCTGQREGGKHVPMGSLEVGGRQGC